MYCQSTIYTVSHAPPSSKAESTDGLNWIACSMNYV